MAIGQVSSSPVKVSAIPTAGAGQRLLVDGVDMGAVQSIAGGGASSEVVSEKIGPDHIIRKHIAGVKYEAFTMSVGFGMDNALYSWIKSTFEHNYSRKNGSVVGTDADGSARSEIEYFNSLITEVGFPAMDAGSKDATYLTVKFTPEYTRPKPPDKSFKAYAVPKPKKKWPNGNFRLKIDNLDCGQVTKIDALAVKQKVLENPVGALRDYQQEPPHLVYPDLAVTFGRDPGSTWHDWFKSFVIDGNNLAGQERSGSLELLGEDGASVLCTLTLKNLGIYVFTGRSFSAGSGDDPIVAKMYCEEMKIAF